MRINNNFNVLPFYDSLQKQNSKKWYSFGQHYPLICPNNKLLPFQFITNEELTITGNIVAVNVTTGQTTDLGVKPSVMLGTQAGAQYYIVKLAETAINKSLEGLHYLQINTNKGYIYSEEFVFTDSYSECVRLEYWNEDTLNFTSGEINFDDDFKFVMYISSTIGKPEYEFEEELTKRLGYKFIESQTSNKIYKFNFLAPEYICDAMRLVRMCDYIKLTTKYDTYNALSFSYEPKWQNNGDLAAVDVEFDTDCIIQKLESFNRRLKESFYNALLADIDEPVLFSNDTVAQYYTEFTTTSYINGKLIRQLEAISENELSQSINDIVLPIDNQSDTNQVAKKVFLSKIINKFAPQVDLSKYLLKSVWDSVFELRNDIETGKQYIYGKLPVVLQYGLTMYSGDGVDIPSIYEGLPIDNDTIYWEDGILKAKAGAEGAITEITSSMVTSALGYTPYDASNPNGYITSAALANYALSSDVAAVSSKLNDFLEGSDTDNIINKWKELESFLTGLSQSDNLATILGNKAEKTDLAKYIPIAGATDITGEKNFIGGLKVNGSPIYYDTEKKYWKLEGDLLVTGGVTMYGNDSEFVASTIMDAIVVDGTTISKDGGVLKFIGSVGGATTLGSLTNVGSWADSVASQDRIMYQAANSSQWVAKNLSDLAVGGVTGDYLPLSGGIMTGDIVFTSVGSNYPSKAIAFKTQNTKYLYAKADELYFGVDGSATGKIWHSSNDGSGSGLDADLLDGVHLWDGQWNSIPRISSDGVMEIGKYIDFHHATSIVDYSVRILSPNIEGVIVTLPSSSGTLALTTSNVASATKLQTERTIWGQSFNGTGNVDGTFTVTSNENLPIRIHSYYSSSWVSAILATNTSLVAGQHFNINVGYGDSARNNAWVGYYHAGVGSTSNRLSMGLHSVDDVINILGTGNVGIGTTNPGDKLSIAGGCGVNDYLNIVATNNITAQFTMYASSGGWRFQNNPNANGNLELIFRSPSAVFTSVANFTSSGNLLVTGGVTMYSARKLKNIQDERGLSLEELSVIKPTRFTWKDGRDNRLHIGGIADDVMKVLPEVIYKTGEDETLTMDYGNAAFAIAASLIKPVVNHEERIKLLEEENKRLKEEVEYLKLNIA